MRGGSRAMAAIGMLCGAVVPLLLAGCGPLTQLGAGTHTPAAQVYPVTARVTTLVIKSGSGSIDVTGSSRGTISVSQQADYGKTAPTATHVVSGTTLTLGYTCPPEFVCSVSYDVQVPAGVAVRVSSASGAITLTSLAGAVTAQTSAGLITATGLTSPTASLKSDAGGIDATFSAAPASVHANTNVGPISISVPGSASYAINTHTYVGSSTVTVPKSTASSHAISASSDLGSITIEPS
jgi:Putative adhesin